LPPDATLEIVDLSRNALPPGELRFSVGDLARPPVNDPSGPVLWRGRVTYGSSSSVLIWAKVRVLAKETWVEAARPIPAGRLIEAADLTVREEQRFPFAAPPLRDPQAAIGKAASRALAQGHVLTASLLVAAHDVRSGDAVDVEVASRGVRLRFPARALSSGRVDDFILIGLDSGRKVRAMVREKGRVRIDAGK
jgi:flagella basal body P-ring formation protein FlgA